MNSYVVDASVAFKWFVSEPDSEAALLLLTPSHILVAPDFLWLEVSSAVCQRIQRKQLLPNDGVEILQALRRFAIRIFPSADLLDRALNLSIETSTSVYDCLYLALAISRDARMITADRKYYRAIEPGPYANHISWIRDIPQSV